MWYRDGLPGYSATNYGSDPDIDNYSYPTVPIIALGYFRFDLGSLPFGATLDSATFTLAKVTTNPQQSPQGVHSDDAANLVADRFAVYGLQDVPGNTPQNWHESTLTGDTTGEEFSFPGANMDPPVDTATRTIDLDDAGESVTSNSASISGSALVDFV